MPNLEWGIPISLTSPRGTIDFNTPTGPYSPTQRDLYFLDRDGGCKMTTGPVRVTSDNIPQGDGEIFHRRFLPGTYVDLKVTLCQAGGGDAKEPACGEDLVRMMDSLALVLGVMKDPSLAGRLTWSPTGYGDRLLTDCLWLTEFDQQGQEGTFQIVTFAIDSPFPYGIDSFQTVTPLSDGVPVTITNGGNTDFSPVVQVYGPTSAFVLHNNTTGELISYDAAFPGASAIPGGHYAEFDFFRNTVFEDGDGADLSAGIDQTDSDYWTMPPGDSEFELDGADGQALTNGAWL